MRCAFIAAYRCHKHRSVKNGPHMAMISQAISHFKCATWSISGLNRLFKERTRTRAVEVCE
jgi:hypothetical protein